MSYGVGKVAGIFYKRNETFTSLDQSPLIFSASASKLDKCTLTPAHHLRAFSVKDFN